MDVISIQPITSRPIIDSISSSDFMLIGDASDNGIVKRVLVSSLTDYFLSLIPADIDIVTPPPAPSFVYRVNVGGDSYVDSFNNPWLADSESTHQGGELFGTGNSIANTSDPTLYQSERFGELSYTIPVTADLSYTIKLYFAETFDSNFAIGSRLFRIKINGNIVLDNFDIFSEVGGNTALIKAFSITNSAANIVISLENIVENAKLCAIEVLGA